MCLLRPENACCVFPADCYKKGGDLPVVWGDIPAMMVRDGVKKVATDAVLHAAITIMASITSIERDDIKTISNLL
jgi:hypothetical protein